MLTQTNLIVLLYSLPVYQLLFFTIQLISFKKSNTARKYLGIMFLAMTLFLIINALFHLGYDFPLLFYFWLPLLLMLLPFKFLYLLSLFQKFDEPKALKTIILFIPTLLVLLVELLDLRLASLFKQATFPISDYGLFFHAAKESNSFLNTIRALFLLVIFVQIVFAVLRVTNLIKKEKQRFMENHKQYAHINLRWIYIISISLLVFIICCALFVLIFSGAEIFLAAIFNLLVLASAGLAGFYAMKQDALIQEVGGVSSVKTLSLKENYDGRTKPQADVSDEEVAEVVEKIENFMQQHKPYLKKDYSINDLSTQIKVKRHRLTPIINDAMGTNFSGLINAYRIQEAIRILENDTHKYTIDAIADMAGFHSRSTFYACFKKFTGVTPKEYLKK
jgi:AraC-like DNA-binding protein